MSCVVCGTTRREVQWSFWLGAYVCRKCYEALFVDWGPSRARARGHGARGHVARVIIAVVVVVKDLKALLLKDPRVRNETEKLIVAAERGEWGTLKQAGWLPVYQALRDWWAKRFTANEFGAYLDLLEDHDPNMILAALRDLGTEQWRPAPSQLLRQLQGDSPSPRRSLGGEKLRKDQQPQALEAGYRLLQTSEAKICDCLNRPFEVLVDRNDVLFCATCGGVEQGQAYEIEDWANDR